MINLDRYAPNLKIRFWLEAREFISECSVTKSSQDVGQKLKYWSFYTHKPSAKLNQSNKNQIRHNLRVLRWLKIKQDHISLSLSSQGYSN